MDTTSRRKRVAERLSSLIDSDVETFAKEVGINHVSVARAIIGTGDLTAVEGSKIAEKFNKGLSYVLGYVDEDASLQDQAEYSVMYELYQKYTAAPVNVRKAIDSLLK